MQNGKVDFERFPTVQKNRKTEVRFSEIKNYDAFLENGFEFIKHDYINRNCFLNKELNVQIFNNVETGLAKSINDRGELVLLKEDKELVLTIGDILWMKH